MSWSELPTFGVNISLNQSFNYHFSRGKPFPNTIPIKVKYTRCVSRHLSWFNHLFSQNLFLVPWNILDNLKCAVYAAFYMQFTWSSFQNNIIQAITRVGNWNEDLFLAAEIEKDFERRKANGELKHQKLEKIRTQFLSPVNTSPHGDKVVSLGDIVMIKNLHLSHSVAVFSDNQIHYSVTGNHKIVST